MDKFVIKGNVISTNSSKNIAENITINVSKETDLISNSDVNIASCSKVAIKEKQNLKLDNVFEKLDGVKGRKMVRCTICYRHKQTLLMHIKQKNHIPAICSELGTAPRKELLKNHLQSVEHVECVKVFQLSKLTADKIKQIAPMDKCISQQNQKLANKIGRFMCTIFNDAKRGTLSAWSWPSREVVDLKRENLDIAKEFQPIVPKEGDLQYVNPTNYTDFLKCIVQADVINLKNKLDKCLAISLRVDGSVDRTQVDNIHILVKIITENGDPEILFIGFEEPEVKGAIGHFNAIKIALCKLFEWDKILPMISSIVTDGANVNIGQKTGLWALFEKDRKDKCIEIPFLKMWCAVHRSALAWEALTMNVIELKKCIQLCSSISTYFHQSGIRTRELKQLADEDNINLLSLPKYFEVRWTEFTYDLLISVLRNWRIFVKYFKLQISEDKNNTAAGFYKMLTDIKNLKLLCFMADLGYLYSRFQKQIQSDDILIFDLEDKRNTLIKMIENLKSFVYPGGWEELLEKQLVFSNTEDSVQIITLHNIELQDKMLQIRKKKNHNLYVSDSRSFNAIRHDAIQHILTYLNDRLDTSALSVLKPLRQFSEFVTPDELKNCHRLICPDYRLIDFVASYQEACRVEELKSHISINILKIVLKNESWKSLSTSLARIFAAKPHSADVERLISYYNIMKTSRRSSLTPEIIKDSLYIRINMVTVNNFNPQPAVLKWLNKKDRHSKKHTKATQQEYYEGVFPEAKRQRNQNLSEVNTHIMF